MMLKRYLSISINSSPYLQTSYIYSLNFQKNIYVKTIASDVTKNEEEKNDDFMQNLPHVDFEASGKSTPSLHIPISTAPISQVPPQPSATMTPSYSTIPDTMTYDIYYYI